MQFLIIRRCNLNGTVKNIPHKGEQYRLEKYEEIHVCSNAF